MTLPVLFLPGLLCDADLWTAQLAAVSADIQAGRIVADGPSGGTQAFPLDPSADRTQPPASFDATLATV